MLMLLFSNWKPIGQARNEARRRERRFNGSGHGEKTNDLLVARRQKPQRHALKLGHR